MVSLDGSLNKKAKLLQMDIAVAFWNKKSNEVEMHYFSSAFLGHSAARDLCTAFQNELKEVDLNNMLQVSIDGPNVNLAFLR